MPRHARYEPLNVFLNSRIVGQLRREASGAITFRYDRSWLDWTPAMPVSLSLPKREQPYVGASVNAVFENLLPDNAALRRRIAERARAEGADAYSLLGAIGHDCVGALQFLSPGEDPGPAGRIDGTPIGDDEIAEILDNLTTAPLGITEDASFRISIAGAQEKTALLFWKERWHKPRGTTATTHILKPCIGQLANGVDLTDSVENEYLCLKIMEALKLPVAKATITRFSHSKVLVVERFDRLWTSDNRLLRVPQEDCCQALSVPPTRKYESDGGPGMIQILQLLQGSDEPIKDQLAFLKANVVYWLLGATDGHAKNFSISLLEGGRYHLTPFYDVVSAQPSVNAKQVKWNQFKLAMAVGTKRHCRIKYIAPRHFVQTARKAGLGEVEVISMLEQLRDAIPAAIETVVSQLPNDFPEHVSKPIVTGLKHRTSLLKNLDSSDAKESSEPPSAEIDDHEHMEL